MIDGILGLGQIGAIQEFTGCDFGTAFEIFKAAHSEPEPPAALTDNVIYGVDFAARRRVDHG